MTLDLDKVNEEQLGVAIVCRHMGVPIWVDSNGTFRWTCDRRWGFGFAKTLKTARERIAGQMEKITGSFYEGKEVWFFSDRYRQPYETYVRKGMVTGVFGNHNRVMLEVKGYAHRVDAEFVYLLKTKKDKELFETAKKKADTKRRYRKKESALSKELRDIEKVAKDLKKKRKAP